MTEFYKQVALNPKYNFIHLTKSDNCLYNVVGREASYQPYMG